MRNVFGGFVAEQASVDEYPSLSAFAEDVSAGKFTDYFWTTRLARYRRGPLHQRDAVELEISISPGEQIPRYATINGKPIDMPIVEIDGLKTEKLPLLDEPFQSVPSFFPWKDFSVVWYDWPYAIGDREDE